MFLAFKSKGNIDTVTPVNTEKHTANVLFKEETSVSNMMRSETNTLCRKIEMQLKPSDKYVSCRYFVWQCFHCVFTMQITVHARMLIDNEIIRSEFHQQNTIEIDGIPFHLSALEIEKMFKNTFGDVARVTVHIINDFPIGKRVQNKKKQKRDCDLFM